MAIPSVAPMIGVVTPVGLGSGLEGTFCKYGLVTQMSCQRGGTASARVFTKVLAALLPVASTEPTSLA